jgi:hypothetical protein
MNLIPREAVGGIKKEPQNSGSPKVKQPIVFWRFLNILRRNA